MVTSSCLRQSAFQSTIIILSQYSTDGNHRVAQLVVGLDTGCEEIVLSDCERGNDTESKIKLNLKHIQTLRPTLCSLKFTFSGEERSEGILKHERFMYSRHE